jgi:hypothetical protein
LDRFRLDDVIEEDGLLVEKRALVQSVARVQVEGEVDYGCCEGEAAELLGWRLALLSFGQLRCGFGGIVRTRPDVKPMVV